MRTRRFPLLTLVLGCALAIAACDGVGGGTGVSVAGSSSVDGFTDDLAQATPAPKPFPTLPATTPTPKVATPPPASPDVTLPEPSPTGELPLPLVTLAPGATQAVSPSPYHKTGVPTDLAISGPGYFMMSTKPAPSSAADLLLSRNGHFSFAHDTEGTPPLWRLRHATFGFYVVGYMLPGGTAAGAPEETSAPDHAELSTTWAGEATQALGLFVDAERNPDAPGALVFDFAGRVLDDASEPRGPDGGPLETYLGIAQVTTPAGLTPVAGFDGVFKYAVAAGTLQLGVAVSGDNRPVGNQNLILVSTLDGVATTPASQ